MLMLTFVAPVPPNLFAGEEFGLEDVAEKVDRWVRLPLAPTPSPPPFPLMLLEPPPPLLLLLLLPPLSILLPLVDLAVLLWL